MDKQQLMDFAAEKFESQLGLYLSEILSLEGDKFIITSGNKMGMSIASLGLKLSPEEHGYMGDFLTALPSFT